MPDARAAHVAELESLGREVDAGTQAMEITPAALAALARSNLMDMKSERGGGAVCWVWSARGILQLLLLQSNLRRGASLSVALADALRVIIGPGGEELAGEVASGAVPLPSIKAMREAQLRLDICSMVMQRVLSGRTSFRRHIMIDASPQLGRNFLIGREDRFAITPEAACTPQLRVTMALDAAFESRMLPLSTLGQGRAGVMKKTKNIVSMYLNECESAEQFDAVRHEVVSFTTDQGAEKFVADMSLAVIGRADAYPASDPRSFLWPRALHIVGHLHVLFNALEETCKSSSVSDKYFDTLRAVTGFLSSKQLRRKFQKVCVENKPCRSVFDHFPRTHVDWRWEFLGPAIRGVKLRLPHLVDNFDIGAMQRSETTKGSDSVLLSGLAAALTGARFFDACCDMFAAIAAPIEHFASKLEGCHCHEAIWMRRQSHRTRTKRLREATGFSQCPWKGRNAAYMAASGRKALLDSISAARSDDFDASLSRLPFEDRSSLIVEFEKLKRKAVEIIAQKLAFWLHIPYSAAGIFWGCLPVGCRDLSREIAQKAVAEYDEAVAAGRESVMHRVSRLVFSNAFESGREIRLWLSTPGARLEAFPHAFGAVQDIALISVIERKIEAEHAKIKRAGTHAPNSLPPYICAAVRKPANVEMLRKNSEFWELCAAMWRKKSLYDEVLQLRKTPAELRLMTRAAKVLAIYQADMDSEFADTRPAQIADKMWRNALPALPPVAAHRGGWDLQFVRCLKEFFEASDVFSLPRAFFKKWIAGTEAPQELRDGLVDLQMTLAVASEAPRDLDWGGDAAHHLSWFRIVTASPEKRQNVDIPHAPQTRTTVTVSRLQLLAAYARQDRVLVRDEEGLLNLDVSFLVHDFPQTVRSLLRWSVHDNRVVVAPKHGADTALALDAGGLLPPPIADEESTALVPVSQSATTVGKSQRIALAQVHDRGGLVGSVPFSSLQGVRADALDALAERRAVELSRDEFGELQVALHAPNLTYESMQVLRNPVQAHRLLLGGAAVEHCKVFYLLRLAEEGFEEGGRDAAPMTSGGQRLFVVCKERPRQYYAALFDHASIFAKGVSEIHHDQVEGYYRCLRCLCAEKLLPLLEDTDAWSNGRFLDAIKAAGGDGEHEELPTLDDEVEQLLDADDLPVALAAVPPAIEDSQWQRCDVDMGEDTEKMRLWFDNEPHDGRACKRGFSHCVAHGCTKYVPVCGDLRTFAASMWLWHRHGITPDGAKSKPDHLRFWPSPDAVAEATASIRITFS